MNHLAPLSRSTPFLFGSTSNNLSGTYELMIASDILYSNSVIFFFVADNDLIIITGNRRFDYFDRDVAASSW
jgi:hypothetical protein